MWLVGLLFAKWGYDYVRNIIIYEERQNKFKINPLLGRMEATVCFKLRQKKRKEKKLIG